MYDEFLARWHFHKHPFRSAAIPSNGGGDSLDSSLDPTKEPESLDYYYDVYDWNHGLQLQGTAELNLRTFCTTGQVPSSGPMLFLVSGIGKTGRGSLINLIRFRISEVARQTPVVVRCNLDGLDKSVNIKNVARSIIHTYKRLKLLSDPDGVWELYERETKEVMIGGDSCYSNLFTLLADDLYESSQAPLVLLINGGDHHDMWACVYGSTAPLRPLVFVETAYHAKAITCRNLMLSAGKNVVLIKSNPLDLTQTLEYVRERFEAERPKELDLTERQTLAPFSQAALSILFEPGPKLRPGEMVHHPIGWLKTTLRRVLDHHLEQLRQKKIPAEAEIEPAVVLEVRELMNFGR
jgi:hypothetical protein